MTRRLYTQHPDGTPAGVISMTTAEVDKLFDANHRRGLDEGESVSGPDGFTYTDLVAFFEVVSGA